MIQLKFKVLCRRTDVQLIRIVNSDKYAEQTKQAAFRIVNTREKLNVKSEVITALVAAIQVMANTQVGAQDYHETEAAMNKCSQVLEFYGTTHEDK